MGMLNRQTIIVGSDSSAGHMKAVKVCRLAKEKKPGQ